MMRRSFALILPLGLALVLSRPTPVAAQTPDVAKYEIGALPAGVVVFTGDGTDAPGFASYALAGTFTFNLNRFVGIEGEVGGNIGITQDLDLTAGTVSARPPHQIVYSGNVVYSLGGASRSFVPYAIGGVGGLHLFKQAEVGVSDSRDLLVLDIGGGLKVRVSDRWGFRVDYRLLSVRSANDAPAFFGGLDDTRFGNRIAGGLTFDFGR